MAWPDVHDASIKVSEQRFPRKTADRTVEVLWQRISPHLDDPLEVDRSARITWVRVFHLIHFIVDRESRTVRCGITQPDGRIEYSDGGEVKRPLSTDRWLVAIRQRLYNSIPRKDLPWHWSEQWIAHARLWRRISSDWRYVDLVTRRFPAAIDLDPEVMALAEEARTSDRGVTARDYNLAWAHLDRSLKA